MSVAHELRSVSTDRRSLPKAVARVAPQGPTRGGKEDVVFINCTSCLQPSKGSTVNYADAPPRVDPPELTLTISSDSAPAGHPLYPHRITITTPSGRPYHVNRICPQTSPISTNPPSAQHGRSSDSDLSAYRTKTQSSRRGSLHASPAVSPNRHSPSHLDASVS